MSYRSIFTICLEVRARKELTISMVERFDDASSGGRGHSIWRAIVKCVIGSLVRERPHPLL
jgi:hypothetical protein